MDEPEATCTANIETLPWFKDAVAQSRRDMSKPGTYSPSWFRIYEEGE